MPPSRCFTPTTDSEDASDHPSRGTLSCRASSGSSASFVLRTHRQSNSASSMSSQRSINRHSQITTDNDENVNIADSLWPLVPVATDPPRRGGAQHRLTEAEQHRHQEIWDTFSWFKDVLPVPDFGHTGGQSRKSALRRATNYIRALGRQPIGDTIMEAADNAIIRLRL